MLDVGAGDPDVAQHAFVQTCQMQPIPVSAIPNEKRVHRRAKGGINGADEADKRAAGLRTIRCRKRLTREVRIQLRNSIGHRSGSTASEDQLVRCGMEFKRCIFHMYR